MGDESSQNIFLNHCFFIQDLKALYVILLAYKNEKRKKV